MVKAWKEEVVIPTYEAGAPEKNPMFLERRVYQGSSGRVYPYPVIESISDEKVDKTYHAVFIENEYIKVMILPELGGRIQMAYDKIKQRHFVYYNHVIKPALVGLAGPWISGGIEFNWPQHHRPSTFMPVDCKIMENADGSTTVWVNERERMTHQKGMAGFTLRPGCAYLEINGVVYNPTPLPQTFLWWANPAVAVNDHYQSVFPPDVNAVFDHGKRAVSTFPIATGTYYKVDYSAGVDISNYRNIPVPTSYMVATSRYDFEGGYENDTHAGMLHVANHHVSPGKKQWTWGNGDFGQAWDRNLTDCDGPYIELMAGVFTENQPDFTWLMPYEEKTFTQYFLPYRELGIVKNASKDLLLNIEPLFEGRARLMLFATSHQELHVIVKTKEGQILLNTNIEITPEEVWSRDITLDDNILKNLSVTVSNPQGKLLLSWVAEPEEVRPTPDIAEAAMRPEEIKTIEQLYLTGIHLEQYRHATFNPVDYYQEALRRDPDDSRCNNALGRWYLRQCRFAIAEPYLRKAVKALTRRNPNPYDGEPLYNLGLCLKLQGRLDEAYAAFYKSTWNAAWQDAGFLACAKISAMQGRWDDAFYEVERALVRNQHSHTSRALKAYLLRRAGREELLKEWVAESIAIDPFNFGCLYEEGQLETLIEALRDDSNNFDQLALDYCSWGAYDEALRLWRLAFDHKATTPMTQYYMGWALMQAGLPEKARATFEAAARGSVDFGFPNRQEAALALSMAMQLHPEDAHAPYLLGCLYYDKRQYDVAIDLWRTSISLDSTFPTAKRNLALGVYNKLGQPEEARRMMEQAFDIDTTDARIFFELDQLYKRLGISHEERLARLQAHPELVAQRDDLLLEQITLLNLTNHYSEAMLLLDSHIFHPWEGGEGKVASQYLFSRVELAKEALSDARPDDAVKLLEECLVYPHHLGEGKLAGALENDVRYFLGCAYQALGLEDEARHQWRLGAHAPQEPAPALYYNDASPDKLFYAGMCQRALANEKAALGRFNTLVTYGKQHLFDEMKPDYFAVSLPDLQIWEGSLTKANEVHCLYMMALGNYGLNRQDEAIRYANKALAIDPNHLGLNAFSSLIRKENMIAI
ncbi:MAG: DUF5107 domain-containing protein [Bacteroidales bacterium]|nr:DUF5107 domain-containing protein [Bacteroidales bacterium]